MQNAADTHIQNTAPGPPSATAPATPTMLPVPIVADSAVLADWKGVSFLPFLICDVLKNDLKAAPKNLIWKKFVRSVRITPVKNISKRVGVPHTKELIAVKKSVTVFHRQNKNFKIFKINYWFYETFVLLYYGGLEKPYTF